MFILFLLLSVKLFFLIDYKEGLVVHIGVKKMNLHEIEYFYRKLLRLNDISYFFDIL